MANPVGEDNWLAYIDEQRRHVNDLEARVKLVELYKAALADEPASLTLWLAYCEYFWSLFTESQSPDPKYSEEEQLLARELFTFDAALSLWSDGYAATKFRISDSHCFWNRWVGIEQEQLARTRTPSGVKRISHLFRDRLQVPHAAWDQTSQMFSQFLSTYNNTAYEQEMLDVTRTAQEAKKAYEPREKFELALERARRQGNRDAEGAQMRLYLDFEMAQTAHAPVNDTLTISLGLGLYARALTGIFSVDEEIWNNCAVYLSTLHRQSKALSQTYTDLPDMLDFLQRATKHCPWSGPLWSRYILHAESACLPFQSVESIKHAATNTKALDKNGMTSVLDMYTAWCGFLKRTAMDPNASEDAADVAELGLTAALEDVQLWGKRLYQDAYQGDPNYRLERILIQFLSEVRGDQDHARSFWNKLTQQPLLANSYDFWLNYYLWEMVVFASKPKGPPPTNPPTPTIGVKPTGVPTAATSVLQRALAQKTLDWPERVMEVYLQHCNDYEQPDVLQFALDNVHKTRRTVAKRRERQNAEAQAAYAAQPEQQAQTQAVVSGAPATTEHGSPSSSKRKRDDSAEDAGDGINKKVRSTAASVDGQDGSQESKPSRDREHTSVMVTNLPGDATQTAIKKYFKDYGHVNGLTTLQEKDGSSSALIEFRSTEDAQSALLRDQKYFGQSQISVTPGINLTVFVSNYPPTADEAYIRNLYKHCGEIFSIRMPSLKFNTHRRFCYVSFKTSEAAYQATLMDGNLLEGKFKLQSKFSNPNKKKDREGAAAEGREIRVRDVHPSTKEHDLKDVFSKYGNVLSVRLLTNMKGAVVGTAYVVFESKDQAEKAVELDKTKFKNNIISVELCKETNFKPTTSSRGDHASPAPSADGDTPMQDGGGETATNGKGPTLREIQERSISIMNLPDTVNDARVRALAEKHGAVSKLTLRPDRAGAIVQFGDAATAGKAALALDGFEIVEGQKIRTGAVKELFMKTGHGDVQEKSAAAATATATGSGSGFAASASKGPAFMAPPQQVRRPVLGGGGRGRRGGLGFKAAKIPKHEDNTPEGQN
ncbi:putative pre-mRNA splicing factor [Xylariaceae sp. FL1272]|nr:putative pre-mRNA splicing factor [Xylariaceae sp. FL1272]